MMTLWNIFILCGYFFRYGACTFGVSNHHEHLTKRELSQVFGVNTHHEVPHYELVDVKISKRHRRSLNPKYQEANDKHEQYHIGIRGLGKQFDLHLNPTQNVISPKHTLELYKTNQKPKIFSGFDGKSYSGFVADDPDSHVFLHETPGRGLGGAIIHKKELYLLNPLPKRLNHKHVMFRQSNLTDRHPLKKCGFDSKFLENPMKEDTSSAKRSLLYTTRNGESFPKKTMELLIAGDYTMVNFHGIEFLPTYLIAVANIVAAAYKDHSLAYPIDVTVTRTAIFEDDRFNAVSIGDLLSKFSKWVKENNNQDDEDPKHVDNAVLMTRNGCADGCKLEGLAFTSLCSSNSDAVAKDSGIMSALTVAHELAHTLGVAHDKSEECPDGKNIMSTGTSSGPSSFQWSHCSSLKIKEVLQSQNSRCFDDVPTKHYTNSSFQLYGTVFTANQQCKFIYGQEWDHCTPYESRCEQLFCYKLGQHDSCSAIDYSAAHGTRCGDHKWCIQGRCVPDGTKPPAPIDGQWGEWGDYSNCTKDCGIGVQWRTRKCDNPLPAFGGKGCIGKNKGHYKTCNTKKCPPDVPRFRLSQCKAFNKEYIAHYDDSKPCHLVCGTATVAYYFGYVKDGTRCERNLDNSDVCIQGHCQPVGCDLELHSYTKYDRCGVCNGNGTTCRLVTGSDYNPYPSLGYHLLTTVPAGSFDIAFKEVGSTFDFIGFSIGETAALAISLPSYSTVYNRDGIHANYKMEGYQYADELAFVGKIPIHIKAYLVNIYSARSEGVVWRYFVPEHNSTEKPFKPLLAWQPTEWSTCSKSCAGGFQTRVLYCIRKDDNSVVDRRNCHSLPGANNQTCNNQDCPAEWHVTKWTKCSKSCGNGTRSRKLYCSVLTKNGRTVVPDEECINPKPTEVSEFERCNVVHCPAEWVAKSWGECSASCGGGVARREVRCYRMTKHGTIMKTNPLECSYIPLEPNHVQPCNMDTPCPVWETTYSKCSQTCGGGRKKAINICSTPPFTVKLNRSQCDADEEPDISYVPDKICNTEPCAEHYHWVAKEGVCSVTCGNGLIPIYLECQEKATNSKVDNSLCVFSKPNYTITKECNAGVCPEVHEWKIKIEKCSKTCGEGTQKIVPYCVRESDKHTVDDIYCDASIKPTTKTQLCNTMECPKIYKYEVVYKECSATCSKGVQVAVAECFEKNQKVKVDRAFCEHLTMPKLQNKECDLGSCPPTYKWVVNYDPCSVTCGTGFEKSYAVCKRDTDLAEMTDSYCDSFKRPKLNSRVCILEPCLPDYYWKAEYGYCSALCGEGQKLKLVDCVERNTSNNVPIQKCHGLEIPPDQPCMIKECEPAFTTTRMPPSYPVGCFNDAPEPRSVPFLVGNFKDIFNSKNSEDIIIKCAELAHSKGYVYFALQFFGECWAGPEETSAMFYRYGHSTRCENGIGGRASNFVYKVGSPPVYKTLWPVVRLGCYKDDLKSPRPVPDFLGSFRDHLKWTPLNNLEIVARCASSTALRDWEVFSIQFYGECYSGENAIKTYNRAGKHNNCYYGLGGVNVNYVYRFYEE